MSDESGDKDVGEELFHLVEAEQGYAFVSDGIGGLPPEKVYDIARGALKHTDSVARRIRRSE